MAKVSATIIKNFLLTIDAHGYDSDSILSDLGLKREDVFNPDKRLDCRLLLEIELKILALSQSHRIFFEHGKRFAPNDLGFLGYLINNSPNARIAFQKLIEFQELVGEGIRYQLSPINQHETAFGIDFVDTYIASQCLTVLESVFSSVYYGVKNILNDPTIKPSRLHLTIEAPPHFQLFSDYFQIPVLFDQKRNEMLFSNEVLDRELRHSNPNLFNYFQKELEKEAKELITGNTYVDKIIALLVEQKDTHILSIEEIADKLGIGVRTLQRNLSDENTSYIQIVNDYKKNLALRYIKQQRLSMSEIAYILGFSEPSSFHRFFKKITGQTPKDFRLSLQA